MFSRFAHIRGLAAFGLSLGLIGDGAAQTCTPAPPGLVGWWVADAVRERTASDIRNENPGSIVGGVAIVLGKNIQPQWSVGNAFHFDGSGYIDMGNAPALRFGTGPFSLEAWFLWDGAGRAPINDIIRKSNYPVSGPG